MIERGRWGSPRGVGRAPVKDAIDKARGLVAWALTTIVVPTALRVLLNVVFTERRFERGLGTS